MTPYIVSYIRDEGDRFASANLVWACDYKCIADDFSEYHWFCAHEASDSEVESARAKGMPEYSSFAL